MACLLVANGTNATVATQNLTSIDDGLFLERLQTLYEKNLSDIRTFAQRESRSFEDVRKQVEEMHCKHLFGVDNVGTADHTDQRHVRYILSHITELLESLERIAGLQSFFLVVNPYNATDEGFLGGTVQGRNFWQGHRGCGAAGAQAFQLFASYSPSTSGAEVPLSEAHAPASGSGTASSASRLSAEPPIEIAHAGQSKQSAKKTPALNVKTQVYSSMRAAVRAASGIKNAEMKWTNHPQLESAYNIRLVGWPDDIPKTNPSTLNARQNRRILDSLTTGSIHFVSVGHVATTESPNTAAPNPVTKPPPEEDMDVFEGTIDFSGGAADG